MQTSGGDYGLRKAEKFKRTRRYGAALSAAAVEGVRHEQRHQAVDDAKHGRPFDPGALRSAIDLGLAKGFSIRQGRIVYHHKTSLFGVDALREDGDLILDPRTGVKDLGDYTKTDWDIADQAAMSTPVKAAGLKVLEQTTRPLHAVAGATDALVRGESIGTAGRAFGRGLANKDKVSFSDVLGHAGAPGFVKSAGGLVLDIGLDPTTYATLGTGVPAKVAARQAAERAAELQAAATTGRALTEREARRQAARSAGGGDELAGGLARRVERNAEPGNRGLTLGLRAFGHEVKTSGRTTAAASRALRVPELAAHAHDHPGTQTVGLLIHPNMRPAGVPAGSHQAVRDAQRRARAEAHAGAKKAEQGAIALAHSLPHADFERVIDAIESNTVHRLPAELQPAARRVQADYKGALRAQQQAGLTGAGITGHTSPIEIPHVTADTARSAKDLARARRARAAEERAHQKALKESGRHQGRAEILSRNVTGTRAGEKAAERGQRYAGGGHGVNWSSSELQASSDLVRQARHDAAQAEARHEETKQLAARQRRDRARAVRRQRESAAEQGVVGYFPHVPAHELEPGALESARRPGRASRLGSSMRRQDRRSHAAKRDTDPSLVSSDLPLVHGNYMAASARGVADAKLLDELAKTGRPLREDTFIDTATEAVYKVEPTGLTRLERKGKLDKKAIAAALADTSGRHVILNKALADTVLKGMVPKEGAAAAGGRFFDRNIQGPLKTALTVPNPQYHFTNLFGDTFNAYLGDARVRDFASSWRGMGELRRREKAAKTLDQVVDKRGRGLKIDGQRTSYADLIAEAEREGAIRTGFTARDLPELLDEQHQLAVRLGHGGVAKHAGPARGAVKRLHPLRAVRDASQYREDFVRLASYIGARRRGLNASDAARHVNTHHFDYGDLTEFERGFLRRAFPFYTFTARNVPLQVKTLVTRPGKYATLEKAREEGVKAAGLPTDYESRLPDYDQRGEPVPLPGGLGLLFPKLPATDLNRLPTGTLGAIAHGDLGRLGSGFAGDAADQLELALSQLTPIVKTPIELQQNYSLFFREAIDKLAKDTGGGVFNAPAHDYVPAPDKLPGLGIGVGDLPGFLRSALHVKKIRDTRTGKMIWAWPAGVQYLLGQLPFSATALQTATTTENRHGFDAGRKAVGYLTGLKTKPFDPQTLTLNDVYQRRDEIDGRLQGMRAEGKKNTHAYKRLLADRRELNRRIYRLRKGRGDKVLPEEGRPRKRRTGASSFGGGGSGGGGGGF